jgi:DNA-binding transcriptional ArsR family regulator
MITETIDQQIDQRLVTALSHPLRQRLLILLHKRGEASPRELADLTGERLGNVSYHVRVLHDTGCAELVRTEPRRGAIEHFYRATARPMLDDRQWAKLPASARRALFGQTLTDLWSDVMIAADGTGFDDEQAHVSRSHLDLDEIAWNELVDLLASVLDRGFDLQAETASRRGTRRAPPGPERRVAMGLLLFERAGPVTRDSKPKRPGKRAAKRTT